MSEKIKKDTKDSKTADKSSAKAGPAAKTATKSATRKTGAAAEKKPQASAPPQPSATAGKPLISSNTEEGGISHSLWLLLLVAVLLGGGFATQPLWSPYVAEYLPGLEKPASIEPTEDTLFNRMGEIEREIMQVRKSGASIADLENERSRLNQSLEGVMTRIADLEKQIDYVRGMLKATSPPSDAVDTNESLQRLSSRMNKLEESDETVSAVMERLASLEQAMASSGSNASSSADQLSKTMAAISQRVDTLESGAGKSAGGSDQQVRAQTLVLAVGHLREVLRSSAPFAPALGALKALGKGDPDIMRGVRELSPYAQTGIATMDMLRRDYITAANAIVAATREAPAAVQMDGILDTALNKIKSLVSVRKVDSSAPSDEPFSAPGIHGPAEKAMAQLDEGDLAGAVATLSTLYGAEAEAIAPWLDKARARVTAETALSRLHVFVVSLLAPVNE